MRRLITLMVAAAAMAACSDEPTAPEDLGGPSFALGSAPVVTAVGSGHLPRGPQDERIFAFSARRGPEGRASGEFVLVITIPGFGGENPAITRAEFEVTCMSSWGNTAWIGGVVKSATVPEWVGRESGFAVQDNGEGDGSFDLISLADVPADPGRAQAVCDAQARVPNQLIEHGNVQVVSDDATAAPFYPFAFVVGACTEPVEVAGLYHPVDQVSADGAGGFHWMSHINAHGIGRGLFTGDPYTFNDILVWSGSFRPPQETFLFHESLLLVGQGDVPDLRVRGLFHVTVTPTGVVNITSDDFDVDCS